jgi:thymidylate synthase ThyX
MFIQEDSLKITNFEHTGLERVETWLLADREQNIDLADLKECLKTVNVSFVLEGINRVNSMLICELKDSYVQQSQRYVSHSEAWFDEPDLPPEEKRRGQALIRQASRLYAAMSESPSEIPIEDARYILPLSAKTHLTVAMSADKLVDFFALCNDSRCRLLMNPIRKGMEPLLPAALYQRLQSAPSGDVRDPLVSAFYQDDMDKLTSDRPMVLLQAFTDLNLKAGLGALTSTRAQAPSEVLAAWGDGAPEKAQTVAQKVMSYGHTSIAEQARTTFGMMCSIVTYHQQIRHRLSSNHREALVTLARVENRPVMIPPSIAESAFKEDFLALTQSFKAFRLQILERFGLDRALLFLQNCDQIKLIYSTNARMDAAVLSERICTNAQWEIRDLCVRKLALLRNLSETLYKEAAPACVSGPCREGGKSCGRQTEMRARFGMR